MPTTAYLQANVDIGNCAPFESLHPGNTQTGITLDLSSMRGMLACGDDAGQISRYVVTPQDPSMSETTASCDESLSFAPVEADRTYQFFVQAFEAEVSTARWAASCEARAVAGVVLPASCDMLSTHGALRVDIDTIIESAALSCSADELVSYRAIVVGTTLATNARSCASSALFSGLVPSSYQVLVDAFDATGKERLNAFCEGVVQAGRTCDVDCQVKRTE